MSNVKFLKLTLKQAIYEANANRSEFVYNPDKDFTRNRKIGFDELIQFVMTMGAGSLKDEIYDYYGLKLDNPTSPAIILQREKVKPKAFEWIFNRFNELTKPKNPVLFNGFRLMAIDGCCSRISKDKNDKLTYVAKSDYCAFHLNASYDLLSHTYDDVIIQGEAVKNENGAFNELVDRYEGEKTIFIADRGYESINSFEHVKKSGNYFLIRVKDIDSTTSVCRSFGVPDNGEFDVDVHRILTRRNTNEIKAHPEIYKFMPSNQRFDFFGDGKFYEFDCRVVRCKVKDKGDKEESWCTIFTNLDRDLFPPETIKDLYHLRWGEETSFRELKYAVNMNAFHSKRRDLILQEIYARMLFYNFSERIIRNVKPRKVRDNSKYVYQINSTRAFHNIRTYLKCLKKSHDKIDIEAIIAKELEPVRGGRSFERDIKVKSSIPFIYRFV